MYEENFIYKLVDFSLYGWDAAAHTVFLSWSVDIREKEAASQNIYLREYFISSNRERTEKERERERKRGWKERRERKLQNRPAMPKLIQTPEHPYMYKVPSRRLFWL